jgi:DNA-binding CsgD family transcriptional regulator
VVHHDGGGAEAAVAMVKARRGTAHAPRMCDAFVDHAPALFERLAAVDTGVVPDVPGGDEVLDDSRFDAVCAALADFVDIKSPYTLGHAAGVARLAAGAAQRLRLSDADQRLARRAGWVHDLGKVGVSAAVWCKPGPLNRPEQEQVRLHAYYTERILAAAPALAPLAELASLTHDRLDGNGYFRRPPPSAMPRVARVLAAADMYQALTETRPHRAALGAADAARLLRAEAQAGRLDAAACEAVLEASGQHRPVPPRNGALTEREVEVLCSLAQGRSMKQIGRELAISPKTVDHHLQHIYAKVGVTTRAGATLYAMEQGYTASVH